MARRRKVTCEVCGQEDTTARPAGGHDLCLDCSTNWWAYWAVRQKAFADNEFHTWQQLRRAELNEAVAS